MAGACVLPDAQSFPPMDAEAAEPIFSRNKARQIRCVDSAGGEATRSVGRVSCFGAGEEIFYGTRVVPVRCQSSAGVVAGLEGCEPLAQLLQMLMLRGWPKPPKAT